MCKNVHEAAADQEDFALDSVIQDNNNPWTINIKIKEMDVPIKIDTGEDISFMNEKTFVHLNKKPHLLPTEVQYTLPGERLSTDGSCFLAKICIRQNTLKSQVVVV